MIVLGKIRKLHRIIAVALVAALFVTSGFFAPKSSEKVEANIDIASRVGNPTRTDNVTTWDCVYFGHYKQTYNKEYDGTNDEYFREPIKWRVLEEKNGQLLLLADQSLESIQYNQEVAKKNPETGEMDLSWSNSDLREWLNDDFYNEAFSSNEKNDIPLSTVTADPHLDKPGQVPQGPDTQDHVYILSAKEALNENYGFVNNGINKNTDTRSSVNTGYTHRQHRNKMNILGFNDGVEDLHEKPWICGHILSENFGAFKDTGIWWLRTVKSVGTYPYYMYRVDYNGEIKEKPCTENNACVRPVIRVDEDSEYLKYAGTVSSNGNETDYCGDNVKFSFDAESNTLRIYGSGEMYDFDDFEAPWHKYCEDIYTVVVDEQVTNVSRNAFEDCVMLSYMYLNENVTEFSDQAFASTHVADSFLVSVQKDSSAEALVGEDGLDYNYTNVRSKEQLAIEIKDIYDVHHFDDTVTFKFENPMPGQDYEVSVDKKVVQTIHDDVDDSEETINVTVNGLTDGKHVIRVNPLVVGSHNLERRRAGMVVRVNDEGYSQPWWESKKDEKVHWDCVFFGSYPQTEDADGDWTEDGKTFKKDPIMWRILANEGDTLLLMADKSLDNKRFHSVQNNSYTWANSELRSWLNDDTETENPQDAGFIGRAFNAEEQAALETSTTAAGTEDKVFLLSKQQAEVEDYGFLPDPTYSKTRRSNATDYAARNNDPSVKYWPVIVDIATFIDQKQTKPYDTTDTYHSKSTIWWLIDKVNSGSNMQKRINYPGNTNEGKNPTGTNACVRPIIRVKANSSAVQDAGSIDSYGNYTPPAQRYSIKIDGHVVDTVKEGSKYTLPEKQPMLLRAKSADSSEHLGYIDLEDTDDVYKEGTTFTINRDREFETLKDINIEHKGAALRVSQTKPKGIAFRSQVTINDSNPLHTKAFQYGVLLTSYDDYYDTYDQEIEPDTKEIEGHRLYNVLFGKNDFTKDSATGLTNYFTVALNNLKQVNYGRSFVAKPYVLIHYADNGGTEVVYPSEPITIKSARELAQNIINDPTRWPSKYQQWQRTIIEDYTK